MADVIKWVSDAGKAIALSTFDYIKELNPTISAFGYAASDLKYTISDTVGSLKDKVGNEENVKKSTDFAVDIMRNLKEDLKNANFRGEDDFDDLDDFDFGFDDDSDGYNEDTSEADKNTKFTTDIMQSVAETSTRIISNTTAKSTQYIIKANASNTKALMNTNVGIFDKVNGGLATINHNIINIDNFNRSVTASHYQNSVNYYVQSLDILKEMNSTLKEMATLQKDIYKPEKQESKSFTIDDAIDADGMINFSAIKDKVVEDYGEIAKMFLGGDMKSGMGDIKKHPLQFLTKTAVSKLFPKMLANGMQDFNTTLSGVASTLLMRANNSSNLGLRLVLSLLGLGDFGPKGSLNTGAYEKGPVPFDGMTRKSIVEVIPTYLSKIYSAISGQEESRYDYEKGQFTAVGQLQNEFDKLRKDSAMSAASSAGIKEYFDRYMKSLNGEMSQKQLDQLKNDFEGIIVKNFKEENTFDYRKSIEEIMSEYEIQSAENAKIIKSMWESMPVRTKMGYAGNLYSSMKGYNRKLRELEDLGTTPLMSLFNNSITGNDNTSLIESVTNNQKPYQTHMMKYIEEIYNSVDILKDVIIEGYSKKRNGKNIIRSVMNRRNGKIRSTIDVTVNSGAIAAEDTEDSGEDEEPPLQSREASYYENIFKTANEANDEYDDKRVKHNDIRDSIEEGYAQATNKTERRKVLLDRVGDIAKHPVQFLSAILNIAEDKLYDLVYGKDKEGNSVIDTITTNIKETFQEAKTWLQDKIFKPLQKQFTKEKIHENVQKFFGMFGIDFDSVTGEIKRYLFGTKENGVRTEEGVLTNLFGKVKSQFGGIFDYIKKSFGGVFDFLGIKGIKNKSGQEKEATNNNIDDIINRLKKNREDKKNNNTESNDDGTGEVDQAAEGIKRVKKTGAIIASEGEYILPPDMNPYNIAERYQKENEARDKFIRTYGGNPQLFYSGGTVDGDNVDDQVQKWYNDGLTTDQIIEKLKELKKKNKATKEDYDMPTLWMRMKDEINNTIETLKSFARDTQGKIPKNDTAEQVKIITKDTIGNMKEYAPSMITGGVIGAGVSLLTGMIGGPLLGAAAGAGIGLLQKSDILQRTLFGEKLADGTRDGTGKLPQKLTRNLYKYLPSMLKASTIGGIIGLTPLIPGGPMGGILLGSAIGFAQKNEAIQDYLFGEFGILGDDFKEKVQHALPKMGFGALAGLVAGPFGVTTNILLGSALGFAADTELFKNTIFGEKDKDGNREGGLLSMIKEGVVDPLVDFVKEGAVGVKDWFKKDIMDPITRSIQPISKQVQIYLKGIFEFAIKKVKGFFGGETDGLFAKMIRQRFIDPIVGATTSIIKTVAKPVGFVASLPAKAIGAVGDHYRRQQVRRGEATYMTAAERIAYREEGNLNRGLLGDIHGDRFAEADQIIANMSVEELEQARQGFAFARNASTASKKEMNAASTKIGNTLTSMNNISLQAARTVQKFVKDGNVDKALEFINTLNITDEQREKLLKVVEKEGKRYNDAKAAKDDVIGTREKMYAALRDMGFKDIKLNNLKKYEDLLRAEQMARDPALDEENNKVNEEMEKQDKRHSEIMDVIREATAYLRIMSNPNREQREQMYNDTVDEIQNRTEEGENETDVRRSIFDRINNQHRRIINETTNTEEENKQAEETTNTESTVQDIIDEAYNGFKNKDSKENYKNMLLERSRKTQELMTQWRNEGLTDEEIKKKHAEYIKQNPLKPTKMKDSEEEPEATGVENESGEDTGEINTEENNNTRDRKRNVIWQFVDGLPLKYFRTKDGDIRPDTGHSDTKLNLFRINKNREATEESANTQKSILDKITGIPTMLGQLFSSGDGKDEKPGVLKGLFSKALKIGGIAVAIGALPYLGQLYDKTLGPWFKKMNINGDTINQKLSDLGEIIGKKLKDVIIGDGKNYGLIPWFNNTALPWFEKTAAPALTRYFVNGFSTLLTKVVPKLAELIIISFPDIVAGILKGISGMFANIWNAFTKKTDTYSETKTSQTLTSSNVKDTINSSSNLVDVSDVISSDWNVSTSINDVSKRIWSAANPYSDNNISGSSKDNNYIVGSTTNVESEKTKSTGGATEIGGTFTGTVNEDMFKSSKERTTTAKKIAKLSVKSKSTANKDLQEWKVQDEKELANRIAPILDANFTTPNGQNYTGAELLQTEEVIGEIDGVPIRGVDILNNPTAASEILGLDIGLSNEEAEANTVRGLSGDKKYWINRYIKDTAYGKGLGGKIISGTGKMLKIMSYIPGLNKFGLTRKIGGALESSGKFSSKATTGIGKGLRTLKNDLGIYNTAKDYIAKNGIDVEGKLTMSKANDIYKNIQDYSDASTMLNKWKSEGLSDAQIKDKYKSYIKERATASAENAKNLKAQWKAEGLTDSEVKNRYATYMKNGGLLTRTDYINEGIEKGIAKGAQGPKSAFANKLDDVLEKGSNIINKAKNGIDDIIEEGAETVTEQATNPNAKGPFKSAISKVTSFVKDKISKSNNKLIKAAKEKVYDSIISLFSNSTIISYFKKALTKWDDATLKLITKMGEQIAEKLVKHFGERAAKNIAKIATKLASWALAPIKLIGLIVSFKSGYDNANSILELTDTYGTSIFTKIIAGLINAINEEVLWGVIPIDLIAEIIIEKFDVSGIMDGNKEWDEYKKRRDESRKEVEEYNKAHGTNYKNVDEYNDSKKLSTKLWNGAKKVVSTVISLPGKALNFITGKNDEEETDKNAVQSNDTDSTYDSQNVTVDYNTEEMAGSGSGLKISDKIAEINKKIKERQSRDLNNTVTKFSYYTNKNDNTISSYSKKVDKEASKTSNNILNTVKEIPNKIMEKFINPMENWMNEMQEPVQELILDTFNKSFVTPMETLFGIFGKMITSISNSSVIKTLIGDPDNPSDTGVLGQSTGSTTSSTKNTSLISKLKTTVSKAWTGIKKLFGKGSELDDTFVSQMDPNYNQDSIGGMSVASQGCGPASATMAINETLSKFTGGYTNMDDQIGIANQYVANNGNGVTADYFGDTFARSGLNTNYYQNKNSILDSIKSGNSTVLLGQDSANTSKEKSPFGPGNHYVVANGVSNDGNTIYINDPESNRSNIPYSTTKILGHTKLGITPELPSAGRSALRVHRKAPTKIYTVFYGGDSTGDYVGKYTKKFESGSLGSRATASCGNDGGASFGSYQFIYSNEIPRGFMKKYYPNIYNESAWRSSVSNAKKQWLAAVDSDPNNFFKHEHEWAAKNYYDVTKSQLKGYFDPDTHSRSIQDCIWSWSIHRGMYGAASDFKAACKNAGITNPQTCDEAKLLKVCYNYRNNWFNSRGYRSSKRYKDIQSEDSEYYVVKKLIGQKPIDPYSVNGEVSSTSTAGTDGTGDGSTQSTFSSIFDLYNELDNAFAKAFGFDTSSSATTSTDSSDATSSSGVVAKGQLSQKVIDLAVQERPNIKYIYGEDNENTKTFDCSSFTKYIYKKAANINLNRKSITQHASPGMKEIPFSQAQPGDVIEFNRPNTHVGLYLGGNKLLHNLNSNVDCVITEDLDSNGNRVRKNGTVNQYFYKAGTIKDQPVNTNTASSNTSNLEINKTEAGTESAANHVTKSSALKMSAKGSGLVPKQFNKNRNIISTVIPKKYSGGESNIFDEFMNSYSYNTLNDKTKLQAIKSILKYLSGIDSNTSKLTSIVELLTKVISIITNMSSATSGNSEMIQAQKEQLAALVESITKLASSANRSNNYKSGDDYQLNRLIKNVNELIRE